MQHIIHKNIAADAAQHGASKHRIIVVDSNILIQNYAFNSHPMQNLLAFAQKTDSYVYIHKIVIDEVIANIERRCISAIEEIRKNFNELAKWGAEVPEFNEEKMIKNALKNFLDNVSIPKGIFIEASGTGASELVIIAKRNILAPIDASDLDETITRLIKRIPPSKDNGEGFRDTIIWLNMLKYCKKHYNGCPIAFISANTKEFADKDKNLKPNLLEDAKRVGLDLEYFTSIADFLKKFAEPIKGIDLDWINGRLDIKEIKIIIQQSGLLQNLTYYTKLGQQYHLQNDDWYIKLQDFYLVNMGEASFEIDLIFGVSIENDIVIKKEGTSYINNIRIELFGNVIDDKLLINPSQLSIRWNEI
jgi:hypothetical protein